MAKRTKALTPIFRVSFPSVFTTAKPMKNDDGTYDANKKPKYEVTMIFDPASFSPEDKKRFAAMAGLVNECAIEAFKKPLKDIPNARKPFRDGAEKDHLDGYGAGRIFAKASSFSKPGVVASDGRTPLEDVEAFYAGCYARATVTCYHYSVKGNKGVSFGLSNLMFVKDGDRFDNRTDPSEDFGEVAVAGDDDTASDDFSDIV
jgi:hypothetical protein